MSCNYEYMSWLIKCLILPQLASNFPEPNNVKYLVSSQTLITPSVLNNLMRKGFRSIKVLYGMS